MTTFDDRENAFENKFAYDAETRFKVQSRAVKYLAQWAAALLGRPAEAYTAELIAADFRKPGQEDVVEKLVADLAGHADEATIRAHLAQALQQAAKDLDEA
ncbi:DUF1476 domain-containing protein [Paenirhodobacter populi]|uniref:DUF1476 domain-containing protein n=1 Tax=Paenirhodobacter populi TaxID=2306993 RepID=A0A443K865_9RHOB|nr:DUF1476 domain-containing protein [Sinirhodobacter populi]RWR09871.1 DUF1476 domain-containing protein [Sinirhodobacter populi]RWR10531.1 DUF1476 domain-containing protein [Sinirhodobacter populi]RWR24422.1 DUF1476 domain-containing protein [Sinirhodobacter populi]RWR28916.1 DUF1476 domain-containing protein [Sinirhodobacter populi]RWR31417.1 DUF1476 domain-containing protein [Sinirhodobacter populi]